MEYQYIMYGSICNRFLLTMILIQLHLFTEKDGAYWVDVNVETGEIESTIYDSGLGGND